MLTHAAALLTLLAPFAPQDPAPMPHECGVDLARVGQMEDVLSNALTRGLDFDELRVRPYLEHTRKSCTHGDQLLQRAAADFQVDRARLAAEVERFRHVNCGQSEAEPTTWTATEAVTLTEFAENVAMHVVLHEIGHALVREFDLPVLSNEEAMADAFATHFLTTRLPDRALAVLQARVTSLELEAQAVPRAEWSVSGEHDSDARRARQIAALALAADPQKYESLAQIVGFSESERRKASDYGAEVHRSWRRILSSLYMPSGQLSTEAGVEIVGESPMLQQLKSSRLFTELSALLGVFDWHSKVEVRFVEGSGKASWSRSQRAVTVHTAYLRRFIAQGEQRLLTK